MDEQRDTFDSTIMSVIQGTASEDDETARAYVDRLFRYYGNPLHSYLVRSCRLSPEQAEDTLHQFVLEKLLTIDRSRNIAHQFLAKREREPSLKFRAYLLRAVKNYVISQHRKDRTVPLNLEDLEGTADEVESQSDEDQFMSEWARHLLKEAIHLVREQCLTQPGQKSVWLVFEARVVAPVSDGVAPESYDALAARLDFQSPKQAANRLQTAMRKLRVELYGLVKDYLPARGPVAQSQIQDEIADLLRTAADCCPLRVLEHVAQLDEQSWMPERIYDDCCTADDIWNESDHAGIWQHLIRMPLPDWLAEFDSRAAIEGSELTGSNGEPTIRLPDLWQHPAPPQTILQAIKDYAKHKATNRGQQEVDSGLPTIVNAVLYLAAIGTARVRLNARLSRDADAHFEQRLRRMLRIGWLDGKTRLVLEEWLALLTTPAG